MIFKLWRAYQRSIDLKVLWPQCREQAPSLELAQRAFYMHASGDSAWTTDFTEQELVDFIFDLN